ncbi:unnamed protein product [Mytilus edulis]|uniref:TNFR-Cys domain-containing protein n=1 Tax=Mytilus edulis TaxID=6550 RepID=A0A8S3PV06_MYTED|nr:unnamed protein product [Mytilus edulis]
MVIGSPTCNSNQKMRHDRFGNNICCYTVTCAQGQKFAFCENDQGHDTCTNCPENTYHLDIIDTSIMTSELDPCIPRPTCEQPEVKLENGRCVCDRSRGYFGNDFNNCMLAEIVCSSPGFELRDNGTNCEPCDEDFFKPEASAEHICRRKSHCHESQEIANDGSTTVDRSCKARTLWNVSPLKITTEQHSSNTTIPIDKENCSSVLLNITKQLKNLQKEVKKLNRRNTQIHEKLRALRRKRKEKTGTRRKKIEMHKRKQKSQHLQLYQWIK